MHALEKEMAAHSSILAWRIPGIGEPGGLLSMGSHRVGHDWSDLAAAAGRKNLEIREDLFEKNENSLLTLGDGQDLEGSDSHRRGEWKHGSKEKEVWVNMGRRTMARKTGLTEPEATWASRTLKIGLGLNFLTATHSRWHTSLQMANSRECRTLENKVEKKHWRVLRELFPK